MEHSRGFANAEAPETGVETGIESGIIASSVYSAGKRVADIAIEEARRLGRPGRATSSGSACWSRAASCCCRVQREFDLHDLAIEDAEHAHQRPKLEQYGDALFIVARTAQLIDGRVAFGETHLFVGKGYIVSVRHGASTSYAAVRQHWESCPTALAKGEDFILYAILDFIVDNYMPVLEAIEEEVDGDRGPGAGQADDRRRHRAALHAAPRPAAPAQRRRAAGRGLPAADQRRAAADPRRRCTPCSATSPTTSARVQEKIDNLREVLAFAFEASVLMGQSQETAISKKLAAWAAILGVPTALAGIYGMNFEDMPELRMTYGYPMVVTGMATICGVLYWRFKKNGWL